MALPISCQHSKDSPAPFACYPRRKQTDKDRKWWAGYITMYTN